MPEADETLQIEGVERKKVRFTCLDPHRLLRRIARGDRFYPYLGVSAGHRPDRWMATKHLNAKTWVSKHEQMILRANTSRL